MPEVTYGRLDQVLRSLGFSARVATLEAEARVYEHEDTGALIFLPTFPDSMEALPRHVAAAQMTLDAFGIATPPDFTAKLLKAS